MNATSPEAAPADPIVMSDPLEAWRDGGLDVEKAAEFLTVCESKVYQLIRAGRIVAAKIDGRRVVAKRSLMKLLKDSEVAEPVSA